MVTIIKAKMALAKFTKDSIASDSKPTESVTYQASVLSAMVMRATAIDAPSSRFGVKRRVGKSEIMLYLLIEIFTHTEVVRRDAR
jgi:hypothetical protein